MALFIRSAFTWFDDKSPVLGGAVMTGRVVFHNSYMAGVTRDSRSAQQTTAKDVKQALAAYAVIDASHHHTGLRALAIFLAYRCWLLYGVLRCSLGKRRQLREGSD